MAATATRADSEVLLASERALSCNCAAAHVPSQALFVGGGDGAIRRLSTADGTDAEFARHDGYVSALVVVGGVLFSSSVDWSVRAWSIEGGGAPVAMNTGHKGPVHGIVVAEGHLYSVSQDRSVRDWDLGSGVSRTLARLPAAGFSLAVRDDALLVGLETGEVVVLDRLSGAQLHTSSPHEQFVTCIRATPDAMWTASRDGSVKWLDAASGEVLREFALPSPVFCVLPVDGGNGVLVPGADGTISRLDCLSGRCTRRYRGHSADVFSIQLVQSGRLVTCSADLTVRAWRPQEDCEFCPEACPNRVCRFNDHPVLCPHDGCGESLLRSQLAAHEEACPCRRVPCPNEGCAEAQPAAVLQLHRRACPFRRQPCPFATNGCAVVAPVRDLLDHADACPHRAVTCAHAGCGASLLALNKAEHEAACAHRPEPCGHDGCDAVEPAESVAAHRAGCPHRFVPCNCGAGHAFAACPHRPVACRAGCGAEHPLSAADAHALQSCPLQSAVCAFVGCGARALLADADAHAAACDWAPEDCPTPDCPERLARRDLERHLAADCAFVAEACAKCAGQYLRGSAAAHKCPPPPKSKRVGGGFRNDVLPERPSPARRKSVGGGGRRRRKSVG